MCYIHLICVIFTTGRESFEDSTLMEESEEQQNIDDASNDSFGHHDVNKLFYGNI